MNSNKLKAAMALYGDTGNSLASALSLSPQRFSSKLNEKMEQNLPKGKFK